MPEQRDLQQALPYLQQAVGVVVAAADQGERAVVVGDLRIVQDCRITPVRHGVIATREVTVYVRDGEGEQDLDAIAQALPGTYRAEIIRSQGDTKFGLHADAGNFIGIDADADAGDIELSLKVSSGCRPIGSGGIDRTDPSAGPAPAALQATLRALGATGEATSTQTVRCPNGNTATTYTVDGVAPARKLQPSTGVVRDDDNLKAYRSGTDSVVVTDEQDGRVAVDVTTGC